jgi:hypothetical protein
MRPIVTLILIVAIVVVGAYFVIRPEPKNPRVEQFIDCYIELAILGQASDSATAIFIPQRDSVLAEYGFDEASFVALKDSLDQKPEYLVDIWSEIEARLKARQAEYEITE